MNGVQIVGGEKIRFGGTDIPVCLVRRYSSARLPISFRRRVPRRKADRNVCRIRRSYEIMNGLIHHMLLTLRLNFRSKQSLVYGYIFPIIFLLAFWGIYSKEIPPLANELGQLLTVTILSGACFGMPTAMVGESERGGWRRYVLLASAPG